MDKIDRKIIRELQADGRLTNNDLAEKVGLSPSPCLRRVKKLEKNGIITGYTALVDQKEYGFPVIVFLRVRLEKQNIETIRAFETAIQDIDEIIECYLMAGQSDYLLRVVSHDLETYEHFIKDVFTKLPGIGSLESNFAFGLVKHNTVYPE